MTTLQVMRAVWLHRQLDTCRELLGRDDLSQDNRALVEKLERDFSQELETLKRRQDDGDEGGCSCAFGVISLSL